MSKQLRLFLVYVGLVVVVSQAFPIMIYQALFQQDLFMFRRGSGSAGRQFVLVMLLTWVIPALVVAASMWLGRGYDWGKANSKVLVVATIIYLAIWGVRLLAASVPGGGGLYVVNYFVGYLALPIRIALFAGAVLLLVALGKRQPRLDQA